MKTTIPGGSTRPIFFSISRRHFLVSDPQLDSLAGQRQARWSGWRRCRRIIACVGVSRMPGRLWLAMLKLRFCVASEKKVAAAFASAMGCRANAILRVAFPESWGISITVSCRTRVHH